MRGELAHGSGFTYIVQQSVCDLHLMGVCCSHPVCESKTLTHWMCVLFWNVCFLLCNLCLPSRHAHLLWISVYLCVSRAAHHFHDFTDVPWKLFLHISQLLSFFWTTNWYSQRQWQPKFKFPLFLFPAGADCKRARKGRERQGAWGGEIPSSQRKQLVWSRK